MAQTRRLPAIALTLLVLALTACGDSAANDATRDSAGDTSADAVAESTPGGASTSDASEASDAGSAASAAFTESDLDALERGLRREAEAVRAAQERQRNASTPAERGAAAQAAFDVATIPEGARAAGMTEARYRELRATVHAVLQTLDFQGRIDGPLEIDTARVGPEMKAALAADPIALLPAASAAALRARLERVSAAWIDYMRLVAVNG